MAPCWSARSDTRRSSSSPERGICLLPLVPEVHQRQFQQALMGMDAQGESTDRMNSAEIQVILNLSVMKRIVRIRHVLCGHAVLHNQVINTTGCAIYASFKTR